MKLRSLIIIVPAKVTVLVQSIGYINLMVTSSLARLSIVVNLIHIIYYRSTTYVRHSIIEVRL